MERTEIVETTLGDLIVALTEEAIPFVASEEEAYRVAAFALTHLLLMSDADSPAREVWH